uniref:V-type proton ATPase subunit D n=1 Tax=Canis lupus familiaris TaxID=9615 RepID=A0A8C0RLS5_CANLF
MEGTLLQIGNNLYCILTFIKGYWHQSKTSDALTLPFQQILKKIIETKMLMGEVMREAPFSFAEAMFTARDFCNTVIYNPK